MSSPTNVTFLSATVTIDPKDLPTYVPALKEVYHHSTAEPENFLFEVLWDENKPGVFTVLQGWTKNTEWVKEVQNKKPYFVSYLEATEKLWVEPQLSRILSPHSDVRYLAPPKPTQDPSPYVYCIITFYLDPSNVSSFVQIFKDTIYSPIINEPECFLLELLQSEAEPGVVTVVQGFTESREWFSRVQGKRTYFGPYLEKTNPMHVKPRAVLLMGRKEEFGYMDEGMMAALH